MTSHPGFTDDPAHSLRELVAQGAFQGALALYRRIQDPAVRHRPEVELLAATAATRRGELKLGASLAASALAGFRGRADADGWMRATNLLGAIAFEHGQVEDADRYFGDALRLARDVGDTLVAARASNNLASVAHLRGRPDEALSLYRSALLAYQRLGDRRGAAETYHNLGMTCRQLNEWDEADRATGEAVRHAELVGEPSLMALAVTGRAELDIERGELGIARLALSRADQFSVEGADELGGAEVRRLRALLAMRDGEFPVALREAEEGRTIAERYSSPLLQAECAAVAAGALRELKRLGEAKSRLAEARRLFRSLGAAKLLEDLEK